MEEGEGMFDLISISEAIKQSYASKGLLVDVRSEEAFKKGHLPMAVNIPFTYSRIESRKPELSAANRGNPVIKLIAIL